jgi:hypothetical protein
MRKPALLFSTPPQTTHADFEPRNVPIRPTKAAIAPPMSIQTAQLVGDPVKNRETSELKELVALTPMTISTIPPTSSTRAMILFMIAFQ